MAAKLPNAGGRRLNFTIWCTHYITPQQTEKSMIFSTSSVARNERMCQEFAAKNRHDGENVAVAARASERYRSPIYAWHLCLNCVEIVDLRFAADCRSINNSNDDIYRCAVPCGKWQIRYVTMTMTMVTMVATIDDGVNQMNWRTIHVMNMARARTHFANIDKNPVVTKYHQLDHRKPIFTRRNMPRADARARPIVDREPKWNAKKWNSCAAMHIRWKWFSLKFTAIVNVEFGVPSLTSSSSSFFANCQKYLYSVLTIT